MTPEQLSGMAGVVLSLALGYIPGLSAWYNALEGTQKAGIMAILLVAVSVGAFALSCGGLVSYVTCDQTGAVGLIQVLIAALVANQGAYKLLVKPYQK